MECIICNRINKIIKKENPYFVCELKTGYVVIGDFQLFEGYTLFLLKDHYTELHLIPKEVRILHLNELSIVYEAVYNLFQPDKMNCELLGNGEGGNHVHWHLFPRKKGDTPVRGPVWLLPYEELYADKHRPTTEKLEEMKQKLKVEIERLYHQ